MVPEAYLSMDESIARAKMVRAFFVLWYLLAC
jgi:hypothetical protein